MTTALTMGSLTLSNLSTKYLMQFTQFYTSNILSTLFAIKNYVRVIVFTPDFGKPHCLTK
jgi:hypothetical protein